MKRIARHVAVLVALVGSPVEAGAEVTPPRLFFTCPQGCFDTYLRQELGAFDVVRAPYLADLQVVIVRQPAGNGGERFSVSVVRRQPAAGQAAVPARSFVAPAGEAEHETRQKLLALVLRSLHQELMATPYESAFELRLSSPLEPGAEEVAHDSWNHWVIAPDVRGQGEGGSGYYSAELTGGLTIRRVTEPSKQRLRAAYSRKLSGYHLEDGQRVHGDVASWEVRGLTAHSLGEHWALGATAVGAANEYENLSGHLHGGPLVEFNVFPYAQNATRQLRAAYQVGLWANWYIEPNPADLLQELRPYHALSLIADVNQPWGSIQWVGQVNSFIDDPAQYRVSVGANLTIQIAGGLSFNIEGEAALVRDLINLRGRQVTDVELLLGTAQQPTDHTFEFGLGLTYTFGSVHNNVVNPRFGRVDLQEE